MNNWCVYKHMFPDGRVYIGITSGDPEKRWDRGFGYEGHRQLFTKIVADGWNNIKHEILLSGLTEIEAKDRERQLIQSAGRKSLNTQHRQRSASWVDIEITDETAAKYRFNFIWLDDYWLEYYKQIKGHYPFSTLIYTGYVSCVWHELINGKVTTDEYRIPYPPYIKTFRDLHSWLMRGEWVKGQHEAILTPPPRTI